MVLDICRQLLGDLHDAEDAFQAVFLVLARKAPSIRDPDLLGNWLYGVALRTARKARLQIARRYKHEEAAMMRRLGLGSCALIEPAVSPAEQGILAREQAESLQRDRPPAQTVSPAGYLLLPGGPDRRRGGTPAPMSGWHSTEPTGTGM